MSSVNSIQSALANSIENKADKLKAVIDGKETIDANDKSFGDRLKTTLDGVNAAQKNAANLVHKFETGNENDITKVMVAQQVSNLGFHLTLNVRNKAIGAYREIMNMQV